MQHGLGHGPGEMDGLQHLVAGPHVGAHQGHLLGGELGGLGEDLGGNGEFADVMHHAADAQALKLVIAEAHLPANGKGQIRHPGLVARGVGVPAFIQHHQRCHDLLQAPEGVLLVLRGPFFSGFAIRNVADVALNHLPITHPVDIANKLNFFNSTSLGGEGQIFIADIPLFL